MKVVHRQLADDQEEYAVLHLHRQDAAAARLTGYIEQECFRSVRLLCHRGTQTVPVASDAICCIETDGEQLAVHTPDGDFTLPQRLYQVQHLLPPSFFQAARGVLVNLDRIERFEPLANGLIRAQLTGSVSVYISRKYARSLRERLKEGVL